METLRCPTCLTLILDSGEKRCPACHSRLRKRGAPIVLGESTRITNRPLLPFERELRARVDAPNATEELWRRPVAKTPPAGETTSTPELVRTDAEPARERAPRGKDRRPGRADEVARRVHLSPAPVEHDSEVEAEPATPTPEPTTADSIIDAAHEPEREVDQTVSRWDQLVAEAVDHVASAPRSDASSPIGDVADHTSTANRSDSPQAFGATSHDETAAAAAPVDVDHVVEVEPATVDTTSTSEHAPLPSIVEPATVDTTSTSEHAPLPSIVEPATADTTSTSEHAPLPSIVEPATADTTSTSEHAPLPSIVEPATVDTTSTSEHAPLPSIVEPATADTTSTSEHAPLPSIVEPATADTTSTSEHAPLPSIVEPATADTTSTSEHAPLPSIVEPATADTTSTSEHAPLSSIVEPATVDTTSTSEHAPLSSIVEPATADEPTPEPPIIEPASEPTTRSKPTAMQGRWRRFVEEAATRGRRGSADGARFGFVDPPDRRARTRA